MTDKKNDKQNEHDHTQSWAENIEAETEHQEQQDDKTQQAQEQTEHEQTEQEEPKLEHPDYEKLEQKLTEAENRAQENWNKALRAQAELDNVRQRAERDIANAHKFALEKFVKELLDVIDSLENGLQQVPEEQVKAREGLELTLDKVLKVMNNFGVEQIDPQGQTFNPEYHEAMSTQQTDQVDHNHVIQVLQKGFTLNQRLVRPALVIVAKNTQSQS